MVTPFIGKNKMNIAELAPRIFEGNKAKGFWPENPQDRNFGEAIMLVTDELSEAHEAWRCNKRAILTLYEAHEKSTLFPFDFVNDFKLYIKDTFEDELADACIRLLDIAHGYGFNLQQVEIYADINFASPYKIDNNMGQRLLNFKRWILKINDNFVRGDVFSAQINMGNVLADIIYLCNQFNIDLAKHIELKLQYNASRPHKHGKAY